MASASRTRRRRGKWICKGLRSESRDRNGDVYHVMDDCEFKDDYEVTPNKLNLLNQRIRFNPTVGSPRRSTQRRFQPVQLSPRYRRPSPNKLLEKKHQLRRVTPKRRKKYDEDVVITPESNDPVWLYANYTGMMKDYDNNDIFVVMYSERRD
jgi:hypothetical protein